MSGKFLTIALLSVVFSTASPSRHAGGGMTKADGPLPQTDYLAFKPGEKLTFDLHYGELHAGETVMEIAPEMQDIAGRNHFHISITGRSYKAFDAFYKVRDFFESYVDEKTILPSVFIRDVQEGNFRKKEHYLFNRNTDQIKSGTRIFNVEPQIHDLVSTFYYLRCIDFSKQPVGKEITINTFLDEEVMPIGMKYTGKETIKTNFGKVRCYVFAPKLVKGRVFRGQNEMKLYVSEDQNQIPIRIQSAIYLGHVKADLIKYSGLKFPFRAKVE